MSDAASPEADRRRPSDASVHTAGTSTPPLSRQNSTPKVLQRGGSARRELAVSTSKTNTPPRTSSGDATDDTEMPSSIVSDLYQNLDRLHITTSGESPEPANYRDRYRTYSNVSITSVPTSPPPEDSVPDSPMIRGMLGSPPSGYMHSPGQLYSPAPGRYINPQTYGSSFDSGTPLGTPGVPIPSPAGTPSRHARGLSAGLQIPQSPVTFKDYASTPRGEHPDPIKVPADEQNLLRQTVTALHHHPTGEGRFSVSGATFKQAGAGARSASMSVLPVSQMQVASTPSTAVSPLNRQGSQSRMEVIELREKLDREQRWSKQAKMQINNLCEQIEKEKASNQRLTAEIEAMKSRQIEGRIRIEQTVTSLEAQAEMERKKALQVEAQMEVTKETHRSEKELGEERLQRQVEQYDEINRKYLEEVSAHDALKLNFERQKKELADVCQVYEETTSQLNQMKEVNRDLSQKKQALDIDIAAANVRLMDMDALVEQCRHAEAQHLKIEAELKEAISNKEYKAEKTVRAVTEHLQQTAQEQIDRLHTQLQLERERNTRLEHKVLENEMLTEENRRLRRELGYSSPVARYPVLIKTASADPLTPEQEETIKQFTQTFSK